MTLTPLQIRDIVIAGAILSVEEHETREDRIAGCLEGLEICRRLDTPDDFLTVIAMRQGDEHRMRVECRSEGYWQHRCATAQIEFVYERMKVAWDLPGPRSAIAFLQVAKIIDDYRGRARDLI
jgi:hypothetical protein